MASKRAGHFTRDGERGNWGANLSRALWYTSRGCGGSAKDGRFTVTEFMRHLVAQLPGDVETGSWSDRAWEIKLPNGVLLGFRPDVPAETVQ